MNFGKWVKQSNCQVEEKGQQAEEEECQPSNVDLFIISMGPCFFFRKTETMDTE